jgi:hypothetical protein
MASRTLILVLFAAIVLGCAPAPDPANDPNSNVNASQHKPQVGGPDGEVGADTGKK